ncbi:MAG: hypothetical protein ABI688_10955 [Bacteroidota bacterium]
MINYLEEYKNYYQLRMQRYEGNPDYSNSYESEKAIYEAIASCTLLEEFNDKLGNLNEKNAVALVLDQYAIRLKHYEELQDPIRAAGCRRIIEKAREIDNASVLITMVNEEENKTSLAVTVDTINPFADFGFIERIQIWRDAEIPAKYKDRYGQYAEEEKQNLRDAYDETEKGIGNWHPGWKFDFERLKEEKHRRLLPFPDEVISSYIQTTQTIRNAR